MTKPNIISQAWSFTKAVSKYVANGLENVKPSVYKKRLKICDACEYREGKRCGICGCMLHAKAKWKTENCPKKLW